MMEVAELPSQVGRTLGPSRWVRIDQRRIDEFARLTGDDHWIHCDPERAAREAPSGKTLAHGYLTLSLITALLVEIMPVKAGSGFNYGFNKVRFTAPVPAGARVRLSVTVKEAAPHAGGMRTTLECTMALEGAARPALVAENIVLYRPASSP